MLPLLKYLLTVADIQNDQLGLQRFTWGQIRFEAGVFLCFVASLAVSVGGLLMLSRVSRTDAHETGIRESIRWLLVCVLSLPLATVALQRISMSALVPVLRMDMGVSDSSIGAVFTATAIAFAVGAVVSGFLIDRIGLRAGATCFIMVFSLGQAASGVIGGVSGLLTARLIFGVGSGAALPIAAKAVASYIRKPEQVLGVALWQTATCIGVLSAAPLSLHLNVTSGWRFVFIATAVPGVLLAVLCFVLTRPTTTEGGRRHFRFDRTLLSLALAYAIAMLLNTLLQTWAARYLLNLNVSLVQISAILYPIPMYAALGAVVGATLVIALRSMALGRSGVYQWAAVVSAVVILFSVVLLASGGVYAATLALNFVPFGIGAFLVSVYGGVLDSKSPATVALTVGLMSCFAAILPLVLNNIPSQVINASRLPAVAFGLAVTLLVVSFFIRVDNKSEPETLAASAR